jgi:hypothetical protein
MSCSLCESNATKNIPLYGYNPKQIGVCSKHSWELFLMGERRFMTKYKKELSAQFKTSSKKLAGQNSSLGQVG